MINTNNWGKFRIGDYFDTFLSSDDIQTKNMLEGDTPLVSSGKTNNGIVAFVQNDKAKLWPAGTITVDMFGKAFYQNKPYYCVSHGRVNILKAKFNMSELVGLYLVSVIEQVSQKYEFTEMCTGTKLSKDIIKLPVTVDGDPDWDYMESYMKKIIGEAENFLKNLNSFDSYNQLIVVDNWNEFRVGDLFDIHPTRAYQMTNVQLLDDGNNPVVANSAYNNGVVGCSTQKPTEKGNMVTFSDTVDANTIFYQPNDFVGYPHVQGLYPLKYIDKWNKYTYQFFISVFRKAALTKSFDYDNKFRRDIAIDLIIKLPVDANGEPNWDYMESYMKNITEKSKSIVDYIIQNI